jgi:hypothetical protein
MQTKSGMQVHACKVMQCMQGGGEVSRQVSRQIVDAILAPTGGRVMTEIPMVGRTLYKVAGARFDTVAGCASAIRQAIGAEQVTVKQEVYHVHVEVVGGTSLERMVK